MERRGDRRIARRLEIRFWRQGASPAHSGFTTNVSLTGLFLVTGQALEPGERLRLEVVDGQRGFMLEGRVMRVRRVAVALRQVAQPGVGVRFLAPDELVAGLLTGPRVAASAPPPAVEEQGPTSEPGEVPATRLRLRVDFPDADSFLQTYYRELVHGGMFLSSEHPAAEGDEVEIELAPPLAGTPPLRLAARVVHRSEPRAAVGPGRNLLAGMALRFLDARALVEELEPIRQRLREGRHRGA